MLPIGKDTKLVIVEDHISVGLFKSVQGLSAGGVAMSAMEGSDKIPDRQIHRPPSFVLNLHQRGLTSTRVATDTHTITLECGCAEFMTHAKSGFPTTAVFPPPDRANRPFTPSFANTLSTGSCNADIACPRMVSSFSVGNGAYKRSLGDAFIQLVKRTRRLLDHYHSTYYTYIAFRYSLRR